ncbi:MAG: copper amine oxidase N-terminal domain-containing protein [Clostridia bacterium]|nr:copper amine oxidase N-terminal domain-containing protein [Clostridia bacterium]
MLKKISLALGIFLLAFFLATTTAVASLSNATVEISSKKTGVPIQFIIGFNVGSSGALEGGRDEIIITFPEDTVLPASLRDNLSADSILVNGSSIEARSLYLDETRLIIALPAELDIRADSYVGIIISPTAGIELPRKAGSHCLEIETSRERSIRTNTFTIEGSKISQLEITATPSSADKFAEFEFSFQTSFRGALTPEKDEIYIAFDRAFYLPRYIASEDITIDDVKALPGGVKVNSETNTLQITVPPDTRIENNDNVVVKIASQAGIRNPRQTGTYRLRVYTSADTVNAWEDYRVGLAIAAPFVFLSPDTVGEASQYTIGFMTSKQGALQSGKDFIYLDFPSDTYLSSDILTKHVTINGQNAFDVDVTPRTKSVRLTVPYGVRIGGDTYVNIVFSNGAGIRNPDTSGNYQITVSTSADKNEVKSKEYVVMKAAAGSSPEADKPDVFLSSYKTGESITLQISFKEGTLGNLRGGDKINLIFPVAYKIGGRIVPQYVTVNEREVEKLELIGQTLVLTLPDGVDLAARQLTEIKVGSQVGVENPGKEGDYSLLLCSSIKYDQLFNYTVRISGSASGNNGETAPEGENGGGRAEGTIVFKIDSNTAYHGKTQIALDTAPTIIENTTVVPLRALGDALGAETTYEDATKTVRVKYQNKELVFYIDSKLVKVNTEWKTSTVPATLINNRVMIPARFVSESFGAAVSWDENTREVIITK